jgi:endogenous inhibitor of DNA gyrase (YacG/DUF329 family)
MADKTRTCPICRKPSTARDRPFCSPRCAEVDLGRWFGEAYRIPGPPKDADDDQMTG